MPHPPDESEWQTRKRRIDPRLDAAGWARRSAPAAAGPSRTEEHPTDSGPADYALHLDGDPVAIVEAKKTTVGAHNVLVQAERYARGLATSPYDFGGLRVPFLYGTNGEGIWFRDARDPMNRSRAVAAFHTPAALRERLGRDSSAECARLLALPNDHKKLRTYQRDANAAIERAIADRHRRLLVAMATGTGKTFTMVNQAYRLMKAGVAKRVLFLVDRRALAAQAVRAFSAFDAEPGQKFDQVYEFYSNRFQRGDLDEDEGGQPFDPKLIPEAYLTDPKPGHAFVYVCTIQRIARNLGYLSLDHENEEDDAGRLDIPVHAFDVVIADECHRGYTSAEQSAWRSTLEHFDGIKIGLTATPAKHTMAYFERKAYEYGYRRAVEEGYLVDYDAVAIKSNVRLQGVFLKEGEQVDRVDPESGQRQLDLLEDEREFKPTEVETKITAPDSNRKIVEEIKKHADEHERQHGRQPKILIFAVNDLPHTSHAQQVVDVCRDVFGLGEDYVQKITGGRDVDRPLQRIREFRNRKKPGIAVTVDLLSTGVDIPDLEFIVFLRPVKSRILFEQMLGRGTRRGERFTDKSHFTIFDCFDGTLLEYFRSATEMTGDLPEGPGRTLAQVIDDIWQNRDRDYNVRCLVKRLQRIDKQMSGEARPLFAAFVADGDLGRYARGLAASLRDEFAASMTLLRDKGFQALLVDYPRPQRVFFVAPGVEDVVTSRFLMRDADGVEYQPADYLDAFARYVRENPAKIEAIRILLDRPRDWSVEALVDLRRKLAASRLRFTEEALRKAHELRYQKALVDIISMVKHAADEQQPLLTPAERVARALDRLSAGHAFTPDQQGWLDRIRVSLVETLSIDVEDFEVLPVLNRAGGLPAARRAFGDGFAPLLAEINEAIAA